MNPSEYLTLWYAWLRSMRVEEFAILMWPFVLLEVPRYVLSKVVMLVVDVIRGNPKPTVYSHCPSVTVVLAGYNEADTTGPTIDTIWGTYPRLEIIVVDDGSDDGMSEAVISYVKAGQVRLLRKPDRGGKSSCVNFAMAESASDVILVIDTDSGIEPNTIWEIVQPFADPRVGAVGGTIRVRNATENLVTMCQANEYLHAIFIGRQLQSHLGIMSCASGALGAFRREAVERAGGWDVGPGEDGDLTIKVRKLGYKVVFAPYSVCNTDAPTTWYRLFKQRRRWNRGLVRYKCRKHVDMANPFAANFSFGNLIPLLNVWFFKIFLLLAFWVAVIWRIVEWDEDTGYYLLTSYLLYQAFGLIKIVVLMYYSDRRLADLVTCAVTPFHPIYRAWLCAARLVSVLEETFLRRSFQDNYPKFRNFEPKTGLMGAPRLLVLGFLDYICESGLHWGWPRRVGIFSPSRPSKVRWEASVWVTHRMRTSRPLDVGKTTSLVLIRASSSISGRGPLPRPQRDIHNSSIFHMA